jgi:hypothetical protein
MMPLAAFEILRCAQDDRGAYGAVIVTKLTLTQSWEGKNYLFNRPAVQNRCGRADNLNPTTGAVLFRMCDALATAA